jgi:D-glycero-D-manno-heptose 1,7-bisphosphate phosphatase
MKLVVLDRDGVINYDDPNYIRSAAQWHPIPSSLRGIKLLHDAGFTLVVCTNQSGIARGYYDLNTLDLIHQKLVTTVDQAGGKISKIYYCPHLPSEHCECRKPKPGMLKQLAKDFKVDLSHQIMIGDRSSDIQAAQAMHMEAILVRTGLRDDSLSLPQVAAYDDLYSASLAVIARL